MKEKFLVIASISQDGMPFSTTTYGVFTTREAADKFVVSMQGKAGRILKELKRRKDGFEWNIELHVTQVSSKTLRDAVVTLRTKVGLPV